MASQLSRDDSASIQLTAEARAELLRESQREVLQTIAEGVALPDALRRICGVMETFDASTKCAITVFDAQQTTVCSDVQSDAKGCGLRAGWCTPVFGARRQLIAALAIYYPQPHEPSRRELAVAQESASLAAVAIEHAHAQARLKESLTQRSALADAARKVNSVLTIDELLQVITDIARDLAGAHIAVSVLRDADERTAELCKTSHSEKYASIVPGALLLGRSEDSGERAPQVTRIARSAPQAGAAPGTEWQASGLITVSLVSASGRGIGLLCVADKRAGDFAQNDERALVQLADLAAVGFENARFYAELEARVHRRTQELQESNRELEAFSYSVSHDLRGPLRAIAGFTGLLRDRHYETIDADGRRYIDRVLAGTQRMSNLIDDLLELGRVTRVEIRRRQVDLSEYARAILARLREASGGRAVEIAIEPQLTVEGDPGLLEIALENLLDNAWKFTAGRPVAEIRFGSVREQDQNQSERTFFVQDNGVGFDPRYAANLFGVFQRLHAAGEFPGTGVGLATVQRIVQRHGGRIWADAAVDRGATIYFSIAKGRQ